MTETMAVEWSRFNINVNAIAPGAFASEMMDGMLSRMGDITKFFPRKRLCDPAQLDSTRFIRIHRSFIVNVSRIRELQPCNSGEFIVLLQDGKELPCSRTYRRALQGLYRLATRRQSMC